MPGWIAAGTIVGGLIAGDASKDAAEEAAEAQMAAIAEQRRQFEVTQEQMAPYREAGLRGLESYEGMINNQSDYESLIKSDVPEGFSYTAEDFEKGKDPGYEFRLKEGERVLNRNAGRQGALKSGARYRGLMDLGQQMGSQEFGAARGRAYQDYGTDVASEQETYQRSLGTYGRQYTDPMAAHGSMFGTGYQATAGLGQMRAGMADSVSQNIGQAGAYQAAGTMGQARAWQSGLSSLGTQYGDYQQQQNAPTTYGSPTQQPNQQFQYQPTTGYLSGSSPALNAQF